MFCFSTRHACDTYSMFWWFPIGPLSRKSGISMNLLTQWHWPSHNAMAPRHTAGPGKHPQFFLSPKELKRTNTAVKQMRNSSFVSNHLEPAVACSLVSVQWCKLPVGLSNSLAVVVHLTPKLLTFGADWQAAITQHILDVVEISRSFRNEYCDCCRGINTTRISQRKPLRSLSRATAGFARLAPVPSQTCHIVKLPKRKNALIIYIIIRIYWILLIFPGQLRATFKSFGTNVHGKPVSHAEANTQPSAKVCNRRLQPKMC